jgi:8-oxo-dGTP pyrophosphatase MutT (NUDIX family)
MLEVISAGGIVVRDNKILMLKKKNGDWVLPKGRIEKGETLEETALREVKEETNVEAEIYDYIGVTTYSFSNYWTHYELVEKSVSWYLMRYIKCELKPLRKEGFVEAKFVDLEEVLMIAKYEDEKKIIRRAIEAIK